MGALGTEQNRPSSAAQCVAYIAVTEIPVGQWPDVIERLTSNITSPSATDMLKESTLEAIGYICQVCLRMNNIHNDVCRGPRTNYLDRLRDNH